jgi:F-type H+-transporting ATPase subunit b
MFDFDATLPMMAVQFLVLTAVLNVVFFKPLTKVLNDRQAYISGNNTEARERLDKVKRLSQEYDDKLASSRRQSQATIAAAQADAQKLASTQISEAQQRLQAQAMSVAQQLDQQKQSAFGQLEQEVGALSRQLLNKLLGDGILG